MGSTPGWERSPGGGLGNPLQNCLENPMDRGAWWATVCKGAKSRTQVKQFGTHSVLLPGKSHGWRSLVGYSPCGHEATQLSDFTFTLWRRKWQPTPVFLPGESQGQRSLVGCRLWDRTESDLAAAALRNDKTMTRKSKRARRAEHWDMTRF